MEDCIKNVKDCMSVCCTYQELYEKSQQTNKTKMSKELFNIIIQKEKLTLLLPTGLGKDENNKICIDTDVTIKQLKQLAKHCRLKHVFNKNKQKLVQYLQENLIHIINIYQL